ncbi:hypothetical protein [Phenylobacterium sp.]|uniref:hypothetical protein n=1 Tax=Phenylobacterium sp. TaxID=1871053 RepID=UPI002DE7FE27|nr:hypothetical protein [Phenylobacterium sp.]
MTFSAFAAITACFSQFAVLVSVVFVMRQMRLSSRHQQATIRHGRVQQLQMIYQQASQAGSSDIFTRGLAGDATLDGSECNRFVWLASAMFNMFENMFDQHREGIVDKQTFASAVASMRFQLAMPGARAAWMVIRGRYTKEYVNYVDRLVAGTVTDGVADISASWRGYLATVGPQA